MAVGSLGRRELPPYGDLDLVLVHDGRPEIAAIADALWYPVWDAGVRLDHSVRTLAEARRTAAEDLRAVTDRGEQLTRLLLQHYTPALLG